MKTLKVFLLIIAMLPTEETLSAQPHRAISPYVEYLSKKPATAKEYILSLFQKYDLVFICERDHRDITQYELYLDILRDSVFRNQVGVVFSEVGSRSVNPELNTFLQAGHLSEESIRQQILSFRRNMLFYPVWHNYNWSYFAENIYQINRSTQKNKISWYPSDIFFPTRNPNPDSLKKSYRQYNDLYQRDSLMAEYITLKFRAMKEQNPTQKALIIMNFRHAFSPGYYRKKGTKEQNVARFLFEAFPGKCANVMVNQFALRVIRSDNDIAITATQDGKWDAAFQYQNITDAGFGFSGTPFGKDSFDYDPRTYPGITYQDVFTGFVFYRPIAEFQLVTGVPDIAEAGFAEEYEKREEIYHQLHHSENPHEAREYLMSLNKKSVHPEDFLEQLTLQIEQWL